MNISKKTFFNNFLFYAVGIVVVGGINFISIPLIIESYGIESYGEFSLIQNVVLIFISLGGGWLNQNILRFNDHSYSFKVTIFQFYYIVFLPIFIISITLLTLIKYNIIISGISALTIIFGGITSLIYSFYQSRMIAKNNIYLDLIRVFTFVLLLYIFSFFEIAMPKLFCLVIAFFVSYLLAFLLKIKSFYLILITLLKDYFRNFRKIKRRIINNKYLIDYGWPLSLWFTVSTLLNVSDRYIISFFLNDDAVGRYSAIYDLLYKGITIVCAPILAAGFPIIVKYHNNNEPKEAYKFIRNLILLEVFGLLIIVICAFYLRNYFIVYIARLSLSKENVDLVIPILIGALLWQISMLMHKPLELKKQTKKMLLFIIIAFVFNLVSNCLFIPMYGIMFAAYSTIFSSFIYLILNLLDMIVANLQQKPKHDGF